MDSETQMKSNENCYPAEALNLVRQGLQSHLTSQDSKSLDEGLLTQLLSDDNLLTRYMKRRQGDVTGSIKFILSTLEWRHNLGLDKAKETSFPKEFYQSGGLFICGQDIEGNTVLHIRVSHFYKIPELIGLVKQFVAYQMFKADHLASKRFPATGGWIIVFDCTNGSLAQGDPEMLTFINSSLKNYFPSGQKYALIVNLNWVLRAIKTLAFTWFPSVVKQRIKFCSSKEISNYIEQSELPDYLGGPIKHYTEPPADCITLDALRLNGEITLSQPVYDKIMNLLTLVN